MSKREDDISQKDKYLKGELDAKDMHRLERQALDDPFLMDALEGYENAGSGQQAQLNELAGRLQQRIGKQEKRIIPWRLLAAAASILLACTLGWLWFSKDQSAKTSSVADLVKPVNKSDTIAAQAPVLEKTEEKAIPRAAPQLAEAKKYTASAAVPVISQSDITVPDQLATAPVHDTAVDDTTPLNEMVVMSYSARKKKEVISSMVSKPAELKKTQLNSNGQLLTAKVDGVTTNSNTNSGYANSKITQGTAAGYLLDKVNADNTIKGMVLARDDHSPIPGASVYIKGTNTGVLTDAAGKFTINADSGKTNLVVKYIGYNTAEVSTGNKDSLKTIALEPANNSLSEVVVTSALGLGKNSAEAPASIIGAHPKEGWHSFKKYLTRNATSPDGQTGTVKLSFMVNEVGKVSEIKFIKHLSAACDKKAADLLKNGPSWVGSSGGKSEELKIKIDFIK